MSVEESTVRPGVGTEPPLPAGGLPWYAEEAGFFGPAFLDEYGGWMTPEITSRQADFTRALAGPVAAAGILDLACGSGRHAVELAAGFPVTGLDINGWMLDRARERAAGRGLGIRWVQADMRWIPFVERFGAVASLFTSFGFFPDAESDLEVVRGVARALVPGGRFIVDVMNRDFVLENMRREELRTRADGSAWLHQREFDPATGSLRHRRLSLAPGGGTRAWETRVRLYEPAGLGALCRAAGLRVVSTWGGYRFESHDPRHPRTIVVAEKPRRRAVRERSPQPGIDSE